MKVFPNARSDLLTLLDLAKDNGELLAKDNGELLAKDNGELLAKNGELLFLIAQCSEAEGDELNAAKSYRAVIDNRAPQRLEAYSRLASLLRKKPGQEKQADQLIEKMVNEEPKNYKVYLERGRYHSHQALAEVEPRRSQFLENARTDFQQADALAPGVPEVILERAKAVTTGKSGRSDARQILERGLKDAPKSVELYVALANLELQDGQTSKAIAKLEDGLKEQRESVRLHTRLAEILAQHGDTGKLLLHIEELKKLSFDVAFIQYITAYYHVNLRQYQVARQILVPLLAAMGSRSHLAVPINLLLAQCYSELGEPQMQQDAYGRALFSNSGDVNAKLGYIRTQIQQGDFDGAIEGYRDIERSPDLVEKVPQVRLKLAELLIERNRQQPLAKQDWIDVERLVEDATRAAPESIEPIILRAKLIVARDRTRIAEAREIVREARKHFPKSVELWNAEAHILSGLWEDAQANPVGKQRRVDEALAFLQAAEGQIGDSVELRVERGELWAAKTGPQVAPTLSGLAKDAEKFSKPDRRKLLNALAAELVFQQNFEEASRLWSQLAEDDPDDITLRRRLLDLAIRIGNKKEIEKNIAQIERIEGDEGMQGRYCRVLYKIWQIDQVSDQKSRQELRTRARTSLADLRTRRPDWSVIPLWFAQLDEQELDEREKELDEKEKQEKRAGIVNSYIEAINLGERSSAVVRRVVELLFAQGKASEALALFNRIPVESQLAGDLGRKVAQVAIDHQDFQRAEEIAQDCGCQPTQLEGSIGSCPDSAGSRTSGSGRKRTQGFRRAWQG